MKVLEFGFALVAGYLLGAIPTGIIVAKFHGNVDLTTSGSGRTGATNVLRTLGKRAAAFAFAGDFLKGSAAVLLASLISGGMPLPEMSATAGAMLGHTFSPFLGFKGGRGVATTFGATAVAAPLLMLGALGAGVAVVAGTRYVSLGSIVGTAVGGALMMLWTLESGQPVWAAWGAMAILFIFASHRDNIQRLFAGTERRLGDKARSP